MTTPAKPPRQQKTPLQRAEETLGLARRKRDKLHDQAEAARKELEVLDRELGEAERRLDYAKKDPALQQGTSTTQHDDTSGGSTA